MTLPPNQLNVANPEPDVWTVTPGSPSDSVFFGLAEIYGEHKPDLVISGINPGNNVGQSVSHSGTVNAATSALEYGVPSIAVSMDNPVDWPEGMNLAAPDAAKYVATLVERIQRKAGNGALMPAGVGLNVNLPVRPGPIDPETGEPGSVLPPRGDRLTTLATKRLGHLRLLQYHRQGRRSRGLRHRTWARRRGRRWDRCPDRERRLHQRHSVGVSHQQDTQTHTRTGDDRQRWRCIRF